MSCVHPPDTVWLPTQAEEQALYHFAEIGEEGINEVLSQIVRRE